MSAAIRLSQLIPNMPFSHPLPPPNVRPEIPVVETSPPVEASPWSWVSWSYSAQVTPVAARAVFAAGSTLTPLRPLKSMVNPPSQIPSPGMLWPPPLTETSRLFSLAKLTQCVMSATPVHLAMRAGCFSMFAFQILRAASYPGVLGRSRGPQKSRLELLNHRLSDCSTIEIRDLCLHEHLLPLIFLGEGYLGILPSREVASVRVRQ